MRARIGILSSVFVLSAATACGIPGAAIESAECKAYFEAVEACAAKNEGIKGDAMRKTAEVSKENFKKNSNPMAVKKSCEMMKESLDNDPDCKK